MPDSAETHSMPHPPAATPDAGIHPTAIISPEATIHPTAVVGPRCMIEGPVTLEANVRLIADVHVSGDTTIGEGGTIYPYSCVGFGPQHIKIKPGDDIGGVRIGAGTTLREHVTVHASMHPGVRTVLGERNYLMVSSHVGHDCILGDDVIVCNSALIAGHCEIDDNVYISGGAAIHQFIRVGKGAMLSGNVACSIDAPPFGVMEKRNALAGLNLVGMRRAGIPREQITVARAAYRRAFRAGITRDEQLAILEELAPSSEPVAVMAEFVRTGKRAIALDRRPSQVSRANRGGTPGDDDGMA